MIRQLCHGPASEEPLGEWTFLKCPQQVIAQQKQAGRRRRRRRTLWLYGQIIHGSYRRRLMTHCTLKCSVQPLSFSLIVCVLVIAKWFQTDSPSDRRCLLYFMTLMIFFVNSNSPTIKRSKGCRKSTSLQISLMTVQMYVPLCLVPCLQTCVYLKNGHISRENVVLWIDALVWTVKHLLRISSLFFSTVGRVRCNMRYKYV